MAECQSQYINGAAIGAEFAYGCADALPQAGDWITLGAMRSKSFTRAWDTIDTTSDASVGAIRSNIASYLQVGFSGDGLVEQTGDNADNMDALEAYVTAPPGGQPGLWIRLTFPRKTYVFFALMTSFDIEGTYDDVVTYSFEAMGNASNFGIIITNTPAPLPPETVTITDKPDDDEMTVGDLFQLSATVAPNGAPQGVTWTSATPTVATVSPAGVVSALLVGTTVITAASSVDPTKTATFTLTVEAA